MRKFLSISLVLVLVVSLTSVAVLAGGNNEDEPNTVVVKYTGDSPEVFIEKNYEIVNEEDVEVNYDEVERVIVVTPSAFNGTAYYLKTRGNGKTVILVDPIHVTE